VPTKLYRLLAVFLGWILSSFTWLYVLAAAKDRARGSTVAGYLKWVYTIGQKMAQEKGYAILPPEVLGIVVAKSATIR